MYIYIYTHVYIHLYICVYIYMIYIFSCNGLQWEVSPFSVAQIFAVMWEHLARLECCSVIEFASPQAQRTVVLEQTSCF